MSEVQVHGVPEDDGPRSRDHVEHDLHGLAAVTDRGRRHDRNEDAVAVARDGARVVAVVTDGVSASTEPERASRAAANAGARALLDGADHHEAHAAAMKAATHVDQEPESDLGPSATTYLAAVVDRDRITLASTGDCRAYWFSPHGDTVLTTDDSWAAEEVESGRMDHDEAMADPRAHVITRWLGGDADPSWDPAVRDLVPSGAGRLLLCSDGLWNDAADGATLRAWCDGLDIETDDPMTLARALVDAANAAGGEDNITVVVVDVPVTADDDAAGSSPGSAQSSPRAASAATP